MDEKKDNTKDTASSDTADQEAGKEHTEAKFAELKEDKDSQEKIADINFLMDISLPITVELGRTKMSIKDILYLSPGSIIELNKFAGVALDILVNEKIIARGEVVVIDENFGVRITEIIEHHENNVLLEAKEQEKSNKSELK